MFWYKLTLYFIPVLMFLTFVKIFYMICVFTNAGHIDQKFKHVIFQYGVLLLELVTGQSFGNEDMDLVKWVQESAFTDSIHKMVDTDLGNSYDSKEVKSLLVIARLCTKNEGTGSITIKQVLRYLQRTLEPFVPFANYC